MKLSTRAWLHQLLSMSDSMARISVRPQDENGSRKAGTQHERMKLQMMTSGSYHRTEVAKDGRLDMTSSPRCTRTWICSDIVTSLLSQANDVCGVSETRSRATWQHLLRKAARKLGKTNESRCQVFTKSANLSGSPDSARYKSRWIKGAWSQQGGFWI